MTRTNKAITEGAIKEFIETLNVSEDIKKELRVITPVSYTHLDVYKRQRKTYRFSDASGDYDREICSTIFNCYGRDGRSHYSLSLIHICHPK